MEGGQWPPATHINGPCYEQPGVILTEASALLAAGHEVQPDVESRLCL